MADIQQLKVKVETSRPVPRRIVRPCEYGLIGSMRDLETQLGTVEAYNRLCDAAAQLKRKIDAGEGTQANSMWATDPKWIYPAGFAP